MNKEVKITRIIGLLLLLGLSCMYTGWVFLLSFFESDGIYILGLNFIVFLLLPSLYLVVVFSFLRWAYDMAVSKQWKKIGIVAVIAIVIACASLTHKGEYSCPIPGEDSATHYVEFRGWPIQMYATSTSSINPDVCAVGYSYAHYNLMFWLPVGYLIFQIYERSREKAGNETVHG